MYRVVVADSRSPRDGKFLAQLGTYNPTVTPAEVKFERAGVWAIFEAKRKGQDVSGMVPAPKAEKPRKARLGEKALKRLEAKKAEAEAAAAAPAEEAPAAEEAQA